MKRTTRIASIVLAVILLISSISIVAYAQTEIKTGVAFVDASALNFRSGPDTSYSSMGTASRNEVVVVLEKTGNWYMVIYNLKEGYMSADYLDVQTRENVELGYGKINSSCVNLRSGPSTGHAIVTQAYQGDKAYIIGVNNGWYKVIFGTKICYVRSDLLDLTEAPYENRASSNSPKFFRHGNSLGTTPSAAALGNGSGSSSGGGSGSGSTGSTAAGEAIVAKAKQYLGVPYVWGGASPSGFDCSGFVYYVYTSCGYTIGRTVLAQLPYGTPVSKSDLQPGDIVFFENTYVSGVSHVGIYVGNNQFIHASSNGDVRINDLNSTYYAAHYYGARRVV